MTNPYQLTIQTYNASAERYESKFMHIDLYNTSYDYFCALLPNGGTILDVGCGPGNISYYIAKTRPDIAITGIDLAPNMITRAQTNVPTGTFFLHDALDIQSLPQRFDGIIIGFCMPYLNNDDCARLIAQAHQILNPGGIVYISTMEGPDTASGPETTSFSSGLQVHIYYHQQSLLESQLTQHGLQPLKFFKTSYPEPDGTFLTDMIFISQKPKH
jgi:ubiquinone/menaquinone biosynthesis C-methylase UbiE